MAKSFKEEIAERRGESHPGFNSGIIEWATAEDVRVAAKAGALQMTREAMAEFRGAFNAFYNKPNQGPYRNLVSEMSQFIDRVNQQGLDRAQEIFKGLTQAGLSKAFVAHDQGRQIPGLAALVTTHENLDAAMGKLQKHIQQVSALPNAAARHVVSQLSKPSDRSEKRPGSAPASAWALFDPHADSAVKFLPPRQQ